MTTLNDLIAQREVLEQKITEMRKTETAGAIAKIHALIAEFGLTQKDVFSSASAGKATKAVKAKVAAKYRDPVSGKEWSGRGLAPKWLAGKDKKDFLIG
jgi:DNA-binding protein H-NS